MSINSGFAIWLHVRSEPVCFSETILPAYGLGSTAGEVVEARDTGRKFHTRVRAFIAAHGRLKEVDLFSSACAYGMTIAVSDGSGQYLSGSTSIAESYAGMRLEWRWAEKMSPTRPFLIAFGYDVAILWSLEIRHLRYLIAVAKALSFTQASAKLRLAQSSLTRQVSNLEDEIGARLLKQNHNRVAMTDQGQWFLFDSNRLLAMCAESVAAWQKLGFGESPNRSADACADHRVGARRSGFPAALSTTPPRIHHCLTRRQSLQAAQGLNPNREGPFTRQLTLAETTRG